MGQDSGVVVSLARPPELAASFLKRWTVVISELEIPIGSLSGLRLALGGHCHQLLTFHLVAHTNVTSCIFRNSADEKPSPTEQPL